jgi:hypothetical protein
MIRGLGWVFERGGHLNTELPPEEEEEEAQGYQRDPGAFFRVSLKPTPFEEFFFFF